VTDAIPGQVIGNGTIHEARKTDNDRTERVKNLDETETQK
jgi:hypothetical protein